MKKIATLALLALSLGACSDADAPTAATPQAPAAARAPAETGRWIVVFRSDVRDPDALARSLAAAHGSRPDFVYRAALKGFAAVLPEAAAEALRRNPNVASVDRETVGRLLATQTVPSGAWGLDRVDQVNLPLSGTYTYTSTASTVRAYVIDTGIQANHPQFGTRAISAYDATGGNGADCHGHGTHVAGIVGASTHGVAKGVLLRSVRVNQGCTDVVTEAALLGGIDWVTANHVKPAVANISIGFAKNARIDAAVKSLSDAGVYVAIAAGNSREDACNVSPAGGTVGTTVGATRRDDNIWVASTVDGTNVGSCLDVFAPGQDVQSTWIGSALLTVSGTSMAAPHVAGAGALYKATYGDQTSTTVENWIVNNAQAKVVNAPAGTTNRLLYKGTL
ncbi:MAG TPA: S8 family peptidase [Longimicrobium sp.]|nr:S8 family peptidase [Longimicrobium sp.]